MVVSPYYMTKINTYLGDYGNIPGNPWIITAL